MHSHDINGCCFSAIIDFPRKERKYVSVIDSLMFTVGRSAIIGGSFSKFCFNLKYFKIEKE